ncbi:MAG: ATP-grasp domain-containing protein [Rhodanobacteraceae bacterium]
MPRIALVTARAARDTDHDMSPLLVALRDAGAEAHEVDWDDDGIEWSRFDLALLRSTWDYCERLPAFLDWAARVSAQTWLLNPLEVIRWNTDKHYLADLARDGVPVVPSTFVEPSEDAAAAVDRFLRRFPHPTAAPLSDSHVVCSSRNPAVGFLPPAFGPTRTAPGSSQARALTPASGGRDNRDVVVKPAVGAGSRDAQRHAHGNRDAIVAHLQRLLDRGRSALLQPYLEHVDEHGETALLFFDGVFSHAIRKGPLLERNAGSTTGLYAKETIEPRTPSTDELDVAQRALAAIPFAQPLLYARVDLIHDDDGSPRLLELELVEPSVFLEHSCGAAKRFVAAILRIAYLHPPAPMARPPSFRRG